MIFTATVELEIDIEEVVDDFLKEKRKDPSLSAEQFAIDFWAGQDDIYYYNGDLEIAFNQAFNEELDKRRNEKW